MPEKRAAIEDDSPRRGVAHFHADDPHPSRRIRIYQADGIERGRSFSRQDVHGTGDTVRRSCDVARFNPRSLCHRSTFEP
jgi:hypothetical protein